jgi:hypothetical protein
MFFFVLIFRISRLAGVSSQDLEGAGVIGILFRDRELKVGIPD